MQTIWIALFNKRSFVYITSKTKTFFIYSLPTVEWCRVLLSINQHKNTYYYYNLRCGLSVISFHRIALIPNTIHTLHTLCTNQNLNKILNPLDKNRETIKLFIFVDFFPFERIVPTDWMTCAQCVALSYWTFLFFALISFLISYQYQNDRLATVQMHSFSMVWSNSRFCFLLVSFHSAYVFRLNRFQKLNKRKKVRLLLAKWMLCGSIFNFDSTKNPTKSISATGWYHFLYKIYIYNNNLTIDWLSEFMFIDHNWIGFECLFPSVYCSFIVLIVCRLNQEF